MSAVKVQLTKEEILSRVRIMLDELDDNDSEFNSGKDEVELDTIILDKALEALRFTNANADLSLLEYDEVITPESVNEDFALRIQELKDKVVKGQTVAVVDLPQNFLRVYEAGYNTWPTRLNEVVMPGEKEWHKLLNPHTTGTWQRPKVGMKVSYYDNQNKSLYLFSKGPDDTTFPSRPVSDKAYVSYMVEPEWNTPGDYLSVSPKVLDGFYYYLAGLVLTVLADARQQAMFDQAALLMGIHRQTTEG